MHSNNTKRHRLFLNRKRCPELFPTTWTMVSWISSRASGSATYLALIAKWKRRTLDSPRRWGWTRSWAFSSCWAAAFWPAWSSSAWSTLSTITLCPSSDSLLPTPYGATKTWCSSAKYVKWLLALSKALLQLEKLKYIAALCGLKNNVLARKRGRWGRSENAFNPQTLL